MNLVFDILGVFFLLVLSVNLLYMVFFTLAGLFHKKPEKVTIKKLNKFAVFIPAYKGDEVILNTAEESLKQQYPKELFDIIVIADSLKPETVVTLKGMPLKVVEVKFENSTKGKALNAAIDAVANTKYDYAVILDIDNIMQDGFLELMNERLQPGQKVLQAHRVAKNEDTRFSILDGISEEINNHIFRKGHKAVGLSAALIGSGKALEYTFFVEIMREIKAVGGFDKEMEVLIISRRIRIDYAHDILVFDEKVQKPEVFQNQRRRWMSAQLTFMRKYAFKGIIKGLFTFNFDLVDKSMQLLLLPRMLNIGLSFILALTWLLGFKYGNYFLSIFFIQVITLLIATPKKYINSRTLDAIGSIPHGFLLMFLNLFKLKGADKKFIHTPHSTKSKEGEKP